MLILAVLQIIGFTLSLQIVYVVLAVPVKVGFGVNLAGWEEGFDHKRITDLDHLNIRTILLSITRISLKMVTSLLPVLSVKMGVQAILA